MEIIIFFAGLIVGIYGTIFWAMEVMGREDK